MALLFALVIFGWGIGSLYLVASKNHKVKKVFFKKPNILMGDFLILPVVAFIIAYSYQFEKKTILDVADPFLTILFASTIILVSLFSTIKNKDISIWWLPYIVFYWFIIFMVISFLIINFNFQSGFWWIVALGIAAHIILSIQYPKYLPAKKK